MYSRIRASWLIVLLFAIGFALGEVALAVIFALASYFALRQFVAAAPIKPAGRWAPVLAFYVVIPIQYLLVASGWHGRYAVLIPVYLFLILPVALAWRQDTELYLQRLDKVQWSLMLSEYCVSHAPAIATVEPPGYEGRGALLSEYCLDPIGEGDDAVQRGQARQVGNDDEWLINATGAMLANEALRVETISAANCPGFRLPRISLRTRHRFGLQPWVIDDR